MDSKKRVRVIVHVLLVIAVMAFIFSHSMANRAQSTSESMGVFEFLMKLLGTIGLGDGLTEYIVRKMAHFSEFAALGFFAAIVMRDIHGLEYDEIAKVTGTSLGTVKSRISRARIALRKILEEDRELFT